MEFYYKSLMRGLCGVTGDTEIKTWTFHKGCLRILGNDWVNRNPKWSLLRIIWTVLYPAGYILLLAVSTVLTVKFAIRTEKKDLLEYKGMNGFIVSIAFAYAAAKAFLFKIYGPQLLRLMDMLDGLGDFDRFGLPHRDRALLACALYTGLLFVTPGVWIVYFVFFHQAIPYPTDFPWSENTRTGYIATFATDMVTAVYCAALHSVYDTMFPVVSGVITGHLASLRAQLSTVGRDPEADGALLRRCHLAHVSILKVVKQMNACFRFIFLIQTMYTVLHTCVNIYQVMQASDIAPAIMNTSPILASAYFELLTYCYYGQLLTNNFEDFKEALYDNSWYGSRLDVKKSLALMTLVAGRPVRLESYGITSATHRTYLSSLQDSISYYLILKTLTTEK